MQLIAYQLRVSCCPASCCRADAARRRTRRFYLTDIAATVTGCLPPSCSPD